MDQAIGDLTRAWVLCARFKARLASVEARLATDPDSYAVLVESMRTIDARPLAPAAFRPARRSITLKLRLTLGEARA